MRAKTIRIGADRSVRVPPTMADAVRLGPAHVFALLLADTADLYDETTADPDLRLSYGTTLRRHYDGLTRLPAAERRLDEPVGPRKKSPYSKETQTVFDELADMRNGTWAGKQSA